MKPHFSSERKKVIDPIKLTVNHDTKDIELDGSSKKAETKNNNNPGLSLTLFLQALKSTLHFSAVTSLKSQKLGIKIKTR